MANTIRKCDSPLHIQLSQRKMDHAHKEEKLQSMQTRIIAIISQENHPSNFYPLPTMRQANFLLKHNVPVLNLLH